MNSLFIILILVVLVFIAFLLFRKKKVTTISCSSNNNCPDGQLCQNGSCCSTSCSDLSCQDVNQCGQNCLSILCQPGQTCYQSNCCTPQCSSQTACQNDGCGGICPCEQGICYQGTCCQPDDCSTGICGGVGSCGLPACSCNNAYCQPNNCCVEGQCSYNAICEGSPPAVQAYLQKQWGQFCQNSPTTNTPVCQGCQLIRPQFLIDPQSGSQSIAPITGTIQCEKCLMSDGKTWNYNPPSVSIDKNVAYYQNQNGKIISGPVNDSYCATIGCGNCFCLTNVDCQRFGCSKCNNGVCS